MNKGELQLNKMGSLEVLGKLGIFVFYYNMDLKMEINLNWLIVISISAQF